VHELVTFMSGEWIFCYKCLNNYGRSGGIISYLFLSLCIAHPNCCVWRWSGNLLSGSRWCCRWARGCL